jgi:hypothetical protein
VSARYAIRRGRASDAFAEGTDMGHIHTFAHFEAPIDRVFEVATDLKLLPSYMASVKDITDLNGPPDKVGTTCRFHSIGFGLTLGGTLEVIQVERPTLFKTLTTYDNGMRVTWTQTLSVADNGTDEVDDVDYELPSGLLSLLAPLVRRQLEHTMRESAEPYAEQIMRWEAIPQ